MSKFLLIARHEYLTAVRRRSFLAGTVGIPLLMVAIIALSIFLAVGGSEERPLGYVDQAGLLPVQSGQPAGEHVAVLPFADKAAAQSALAAGEIQAFYILPADYLESGRADLYYWNETPGSSARQDFDRFLRLNLLSSQPGSVRERILNGINLTIRTVDGRREFNGQNFVNLMIPFAAGLLFIFSTMTSVGYLLQAVTSEKENRTIEVMATSVTSLELIGGKAAGLMTVALTQLAIWIPAALIALLVGARFVPELQAVQLPWGFLGVVLLYFIPAYALIASMMIAIGSAVSEMSQGQQIAGMLNLLFFVPYFFFATVFANPNSPLLVALTLFPTTAFITITMRWGVTVIPLWQLIASWIILAASAGSGIWIASRVFRAGMLRYGQPLPLQGVLAALRNK